VRDFKGIRWLTTTDHKTIGTLYLVTSFAFFCIGDVMALLMRAELARPGLQIMSNEQFNQAFTMHGTIMLLMFATPLFAGFTNWIMPLQIGASTAGAHLLDERFGQALGDAQLNAVGDEGEGRQDAYVQDLRRAGEVHGLGRGVGVLQGLHTHHGQRLRPAPNRPERGRRRLAHPAEHRFPAPAAPRR
jgi:hypothetical protein